MLNLLVKGIFYIVTKLFEILLSPIISVVTALFPSLGSLFTYISSFTATSLTYVRSILKLLLISDSMILTLLDYFVILYSIHIIVLAVKFGISVYNKFKP